MKKSSKVMLLTLGFGLLAVVLSSLPSRPAAADDIKTVIVTPNPLPVNVNNVPQVTLSGTPTLNATVTDTTPLSVRDADNPALLPFSVMLCLGGSSICGPTPNGFTVPTTVGAQSVLRLVIEYVSATCSAISPAPTGIANFELTVASPPTPLVVYTFTPNTVIDNANEMIAQDVSQLTRIYVSPAQTVAVGVSGAVGTSACNPIGISGYYVVM